MKLSTPNFLKNFINTLILFLFVSLFSVEKMLSFLFKNLPIKFNYEGYRLAPRVGSKENEGSISLFNLVSIAFRQVFYRRSRAYITIGAIAFAMGIIVLLVSIGYGAQNTVIKRVADDQELSIIDVLPQAGKKVVINPELLDTIRDIDQVAAILPMISVVGDITYQGSDADAVIYGVTADYLKYSESLKEGEAFTYNDVPERSVAYLEEDDQPESAEEVEGASVEQTESELELIELGENVVEEEGNQTIEIVSSVSFEAVVNTRFLTTVGIDPENAIGKEFEVSLVPVKDLIGDGSIKVISEKVTYKIIGIVEGDSQPVVYVPLDHIWSMGAVKFSQARIVAKSSDDVEEVRIHLESMGLITKSIVDVIDQIENVFAIIRVVLLVIGLGALIIASLGMFNTLTVSLLERSREIGLLKVIGMKSQDVYRLFITESLIMGVWGGVGGIIIAFIGGKLLSLIISVVTLSRGGEFVDISYIPLSFLFTSLLLIIFVGILTGVYPARRATRISPIDALRYE